MSVFRAKIGLALGGGAAKGIAHVGVLKALRDHKVNVDFIAGTSAGAIAASLYAFQLDLKTIDQLARRLTFSKVTNFKLAKTGFFSTDSLKKLMLEHVGPVNIEDARIPLAIVATDIKTGEVVILTRGPLADAVCASTAIPGIYIPVNIAGRTLVDGGLLQNVPIQPLTQMGADFTIASHIHSLSSQTEPTHALDIMRNAFEIAINQHTKNQLKDANLLIAMDLSDFSLRDNTERYDELFSIGYESASRQLARLKWYRRNKILLYSARMLNQLLPFKVPEVLKRSFSLINTSSKSS